MPQMMMHQNMEELSRQGMSLNNLGSNEDYDRRDRDRFFMNEEFNAPIERRFAPMQLPFEEQ
jgi:hypothetical protein